MSLNGEGDLCRNIAPIKNMSLKANHDLRNARIRYRNSIAVDKIN